MGSAMVQARMNLREVNNDDVWEFLNDMRGNERVIRDVKSVFSEVHKVLGEFGLLVDFDERGASIKNSN